ncbi:hypothetical protein ACMU_02890 [Actibacterium mucosum KCTC 23349]|uniref:L,D-TPase catalytic domain-containing protein n=1 Tax=Actibacterium mucosum KCTC 23349 TaxID=1454373 RepID=A0A037ZRJ9_9RHOB|nr:L,D-transpeptidase family protein [Actibacterium mucosum]KAJ57467.1 hypothetical protein ACMU_02890 [Actibacterium mucosum KCTC 23349]
MSHLVVTRWGARVGARRMPCAIGRGGLTGDKREGDGATPLGAHRVVGGYYRADRMAQPAAWLAPIGPRDLWCDDPTHPAYNLPVQAPFDGSHERLRRGDPLYDLVLATTWNFPDAEPGRGSAIFVHQWRKPRHPTEGCVAFHARDLRWLLRHIGPGSVIEISG